MKNIFKSYFLSISLVIFSGCFYHGTGISENNKSYLLFKRFIHIDYPSDTISFQFQMKEISNEYINVNILWHSYSDKKIALKVLNPLLIADNKEIPLKNCEFYENGIACQTLKSDLPNYKISTLLIKVDIGTPSLLIHMSKESYSFGLRSFCEGYNPSNLSLCYETHMNTYEKEKDKLQITPLARYYKNEGEIDTFNEFVELIQNKK